MSRSFATRFTSSADKPGDEYEQGSCLRCVYDHAQHHVVSASFNYQPVFSDLSDLVVFRADRAVVPLRVSIGLAIYRLPGASTVIVPICAQRILRPRAHDSVDSATIVAGPSELLLQPRYA